MKAQFEKRVFTDTVHTSAIKYKNLHNLPHWHIEYELVVILKGKATIMINNCFFEIYDGDCIFINSEEIHHIKSEPESVLGIIKTDVNYVKKIIGNNHLVSPVLKYNDSAKYFFNVISAELKEKKEFYDIIADTIVTKFIVEIFRNEVKTASVKRKREASAKYKELIEMLANNYTHITFEDAAEYIHLNKSYFSRYFYRFSGMTFTKYINTLKVSTAIEKIHEKKLNMTEISIECGFGTIRSFNRIFKAFTGYSPNKLPDDYVFIYNMSDELGNDFDPTLSCTEILG